MADLTGPLELPVLDGLVAANSLHFVARDRQVEAIRGLAAHLRPGGAFVVVEYDADRGNPWVPNPFSAGSWETLAAAAGLVDARTHRPGPEPVPRGDLLGGRAPALTPRERAARRAARRRGHPHDLLRRHRQGRP